MFTLMEADLGYESITHSEVVGVKLSDATIAKIVRLYTLADEQGLPKHMEDGGVCSVEMSNTEIRLVNDRGCAVYRARPDRLAGWYTVGGQSSTASYALASDPHGSHFDAAVWVEVALVEGVHVPQEWHDYAGAPALHKQITTLLDKTHNGKVLREILSILEKEK